MNKLTVIELKSIITQMSCSWDADADRLADAAFSELSQRLSQKDLDAFMFIADGQPGG